MKLGFAFLLALCINITEKSLADKTKLVSILCRDILIIYLMFICSVGGKESKSSQNRSTEKICGDRTKKMVVLAVQTVIVNQANAINMHAD